MRIVITAPGARHVAQRFGTFRRRLDSVVRQAPHEIAPATTPAYKRVAPVRTGRLQRRIHAERGEVISDVADPDSGFHYTPSTRFGRGPVVAKRAQALRFEIGGHVIFRKRVGAWHPDGDWAERGHDEAARIALERFGRMVDRALQ
jgi:hypothetical protein